MQIAPSKELKHLIRHYLIYYPDNEGSPMRFFSDGSPGIIIPMANSALSFFQGMTGRKGELMIYGLMENFVDIQAPPASGMIVVVLQPYALGMLSGLAPHKLKNCVFQFSDLFPGQAGFLEDRIRRSDGTVAVIAEIEDFFSRIVVHLSPPDGIVMDCLDMMRRHNGNIAMEQLLRQLPLSERHLERKFNHTIGISPKKFAGILRMTYFLKLFRDSDATQSPASFVSQVGYYDQAHLNNHFKLVTGTTPIKYLAGADPIAMNLFRLPGSR